MNQTNTIVSFFQRLGVFKPRQNVQIETLNLYGETNNFFDKEYGDEKLIKGLLIQINWNTNRGLIRTKLLESERERQYKFRIIDSRERPENITPSTHLKAQATPVFNEGSDIVQELELRAVEYY